MTFQDTLNAVIDEKGGVKMTFFIEFTSKTVIDLTAASIEAGIGIKLASKFIDRLVS